MDRVVDGIEAAAPLTLAATKEQLLRRSDAIEASPADDLVRLEKVYGSADFREGVRLPGEGEARVRAPVTPEAR